MEPRTVEGGKEERGRKREEEEEGEEDDEGASPPVVGGDLLLAVAVSLPVLFLGRCPSASDVEVERRVVRKKYRRNEATSRRERGITALGRATLSEFERERWKWRRECRRRSSAEK